MLGWAAAYVLIAVAATTVVLARREPTVVRGDWVFLVTALFVGILAVQGRRMDEQRFADVLSQFKRDTDNEWERLAGLLLRAKDWVAGQTNLTQASWETWLHANRFPHSYPGALGIGYAEQLLPGHGHRPGFQRCHAKLTRNLSAHRHDGCINEGLIAFDLGQALSRPLSGA